MGNQNTLPTIRVKFVDFWDDLNDYNRNPFLKFLNGDFNIEFSNTPEFLFYSTNGYEHLKYNCIRVFFTGEQCSPDFDVADYAIGYDYLSFGDRYFRLPLFALAYSLEELIQLNQPVYDALKDDLLNRDFCSFVYSNFKEYSGRDNFFQSLNTRKRVSSGGKHLNNINQRVQNKVEFESKHRFSIAYENTIHPGYTTEKLIDSFKANALPIYYGNPIINGDFNENAFINLHKFNSHEDAISHILEINDNPHKYLDFFKENRFKQSVFLYEPNFKKFLFGILSQSPSDAKRRSISHYSNNKIKMLLMIRLFLRSKYILSRIPFINRIHYEVQKLLHKS